MLQVLACVVLGVLLAGLRFALLILLVTMLVPLCIIEYSDFLSLVVVFAQPEKWVFGFYGEVEFSLLCWGESSPIWCEGLVFLEHGRPDLLGRPLHASHITATDCCPVCVLEEPEHDVFGFGRLARPPFCRAIVLELSMCPTSLSIVIHVPQHDEGMFFPVDYHCVGIGSGGFVLDIE